MYRSSLIAVLTLVGPMRTGAQSDSEPPRVWVDAFTEGPTFCLVLSHDGTARFTAGFLAHNPLRWRYDSLTKKLFLTAPRLTATTVKQFRGDAGASDWVFDTLSKTATYDLDADARIWWGGWFLYPLASLDSVGRTQVRRECKLPVGS